MKKNLHVAMEYVEDLVVMWSAMATVRASNLMFVDNFHYNVNMLEGNFKMRSINMTLQYHIRCLHDSGSKHLFRSVKWWFACIKEVKSHYLDHICKLQGHLRGILEN